MCTIEVQKFVFMRTIRPVIRQSVSHYWGHLFHITEMYFTLYMQQETIVFFYLLEMYLGLTIMSI